jgi:hypothetical protein
MRVFAAQAFRSGQLAPEAAQTRQHLIRTRQTTDSDLTVVLDQVDPIAFLEAKFADKLSGQTDGKRVAPFCDLHRDLLSGYTVGKVYHVGCMGKPVHELGLLLCVTRTTYDRAIESLNAVNDEIAQLIQKTWGR